MESSHLPREKEMGRANAASQKGFQGCQSGSWHQEEWGEPFAGLERTLFDAGSTDGDISMAKIQVQVWNHPPTISQSWANLDPRTLGFTVYLGRHSFDLLRWRNCRFLQLLEITVGPTRSLRGHWRDGRPQASHSQQERDQCVGWARGSTCESCEWGGKTSPWTLDAIH